MREYVNKNDPRAKKTRRYLQQAFIELLSEKDFQDITIKDITDRAELNRATFYGHFQDKYELLDETLGSMLEDTINAWVTLGQEPKEEDVVRDLMLAICKWHEETSQGINRRLTLSAAVEENAKKRLYNIVYSCMASSHHGKAADPRRDAEIKATLVSWSIYGIVEQWSKQPSKENPESLVERTLPLIIASVRASSFSQV